AVRRVGLAVVLGGAVLDGAVLPPEPAHPAASSAASSERRTTLQGCPVPQA
ncbi:MAG: hypothetical protein JWN87_1498, partial [Frankiales bacterium]|nr:hypothetical protein [Frankiales bacterium]